MAEFYAEVSGRIYGPFDLAKLNALAAAGKIGRDDRISKDGQSGWVAAGAVKGLFSPAELTVTKPPEVSDRTIFDRAGAAALGSLPVVGKVTSVAAKKTGAVTVAAAALAGQAVVSTAKYLITRSELLPVPQNAQTGGPQQPQNAQTGGPQQPQNAQTQSPPPQQIVINNVVYQRRVVGNNRPQKSVLLAFMLAFFFGPLGMLYSTVIGAFFMLLLNVFALPLTFGLGLVITWPMGCIWAALAASRS